MEDALQVYLLRSGPQLMQYLDKDEMKNIEEARELVRAMDASLSFGEGISWGIQLHETPIMIGQIGLWRIIKEHFRAEIGYTLLPQFWKKGLMTEALTEVIDYGFNQLGLHSIEANVNPSNAASIRLLEKLGFTREGYFRENFYYNGRFLDSAIYSLIKS